MWRLVVCLLFLSLGHSKGERRDSDGGYFYYEGCYDHASQDLVEDWHPTGLSWERCRRRASERGHDWFVMEFPQGHKGFGVASCGSGPADRRTYAKIGIVPDHRCEAAANVQGRRLGGAGTMAAYVRARSPEEYARARNLSLPVTLDGNRIGLRIEMPDANHAVDACYAQQKSVMEFCVTHGLEVSPRSLDCQNLVDYAKRSVASDLGQRLPQWIPLPCYDDERLRRCLVESAKRNELRKFGDEEEDASAMLVTKSSLDLPAARTTKWEQVPSVSAACGDDDTTSTTPVFQLEIRVNETIDAARSTVSLPLEATADAALPLLNMCGRSDVSVDSCVSMYYSADLFRKEHMYEALIDALALARPEGDFFFVQIGAHVGNTWNDPVYRRIVAPVPSVDLRHRSRWRGLLVEPVPYLFDELRSNYAKQAASGQLHFENAAVCETSGTRTFFSVSESAQRAIADYCATAPGNCRITGSEQWISQIGSLHREQLIEHFSRLFGDDVDVTDIVADGEIRVECLSYADLLAKHGRTSADWVLIDAEGADEEILLTILGSDDPTHLPLVLAFEHAHFDARARDTIFGLLRRRGYHCHWMNTLDMLCHLRHGGASGHDIFGVLGCD